MFTLRVAQLKKQAAPTRTRPLTLMVKIRQGIMQSPRGQAHMRMEKTNRPTMRNHKDRVPMHMEKTHQAIIQGRKDQAQPAARQGWDRALHKDPALLEHQQGQAVIKYNTDFSNDQLSQAGHFGNPVFPRGMGGNTGIRS